MQADKLPSPWEEFFAGISAAISQPIVLHCVGGFVATACYGLARVTGDVDCVEVRPHEGLAELLKVAGRDSPLANKHGVHIEYVAGITNWPENYEARLIELCPGRFERLRVFAVDPYDLALSKLERNSPKDREDVADLVRTQGLKSEILRERYEKELRPDLVNEAHHDITLKLWIEAYFEPETLPSSHSQ